MLVKRLALACAAAALLCLALPTHSLAQVNASVGGTVSDSSGAIIPKVTVTAKNDNTGVTTTAQTNDAGSYSFSSLQPGKYTVTAENAGFQTASFKNVD